MLLPGADPDVRLSLHLAQGQGPLAVIAHGAGSSAEFVRRAFERALVAAGWRLAAYDLRGHGGSTPVRDPARLTVDDHARDLAALQAALGADLAGGVSLGAHAAARAARVPGVRPAAGLLLVLPGWTGEPDVVAAANAAQADEIADVGVAGALARIAAEHPGWVADELARAWRWHDDVAFAAVLRGLAASPAPDEHDLAALDLPVGLVALLDDPMHPAAVARQWCRALPCAALVEVSQAALAADRGALGAAAVTAWQRARVLSGSR